MYEAGFTPVTFEPITRDELNTHLILWGHRMGEIHRPTRGWSHGIHQNGQLLAVVSADTLIRERVAGLTRHDAIELSRLCAVRPDLCRVALRLWAILRLSGNRLCTRLPLGGQLSECCAAQREPLSVRWLGHTRPIAQRNRFPVRGSRS